MGKRKEGDETRVKEMKKVKTISEESVVAKHEDVPVREPKCGKILNKHFDTKIKSKDTKCKKRYKLLQESEKGMKIGEPKGKKIIFVDDVPEEEINKKFKKRKKTSQGTELDFKVIDEPKQQEVRSKKSKKRDKPSHETEQDLKVNSEPKEQAVPIKKSKNSDKAEKKTEKDSKVIREPKGKKIKFVDDDDKLQEVASGSGKVNNAEKKKKFLNDDEAEVKEEDIDKFCDEINEKDNAQYEEWVKLIEANFHSNKKKQK